MESCGPPHSIEPVLRYVTGPVLGMELAQLHCIELGQFHASVQVVNGPIPPHTIEPVLRYVTGPVLGMELAQLHCIELGQFHASVQVVNGPVLD